MSDEFYINKLTQQKLKELGFDPGVIDGAWGPKSQSALTAYIKSLNPINPIEIPQAQDTFDSRSEGNIRTLNQVVQVKARQFLKKANEAMNPHGVTVKIISGSRSAAEQNALYEQGRSKPGPIVTNARHGFSWHSWAAAFDIGLFKGSDYLEESYYYDSLGSIGESIGLEWGGRWHFSDKPHYQLRPKAVEGIAKDSDAFAILRAMEATGKPIFEV